MEKEKELSYFDQRVRHFAEILNPLFDATVFKTTDTLFEFVCTLVRSSGIQDSDWDPWYESQATLDDLRNLASLELPPEQFPHAERTRMRLALLSYCHLTEMDLPYALVANLLSLRLGKKYNVSPFRDLAVPARSKKLRPFPKLIAPSPGKKIVRIKQLSQGAKLRQVGEVFEEIYDNEIRNSVYHSDYTLTNKEFRMLSGNRLSKTAKHLSPVVQLSELNELITDAFAFYSALFALYDRCRRSFTDFIDAFLPFDGHYKGILQLLFDEEKTLIGFRVYWPNATVGEYTRTRHGCIGSNIHFDPDGSVNFFVGLYPPKHGEFSLLVEPGAKPQYAMVPGTGLSPHWPEDLNSYKLQLDANS
jgi:hypothetical protein